MAVNLDVIKGCRLTLYFNVVVCKRQSFSYCGLATINFLEDTDYERPRHYFGGGKKGL